MGVTLLKYSILFILCIYIYKLFDIFRFHLQMLTVKMLSSDDDDHRSLATSHMKLLIEKCSTLSKKAMHVDSPNDTAAASVINAGSDNL